MAETLTTQCVVNLSAQLAGTPVTNIGTSSFPLSMNNILNLALASGAGNAASNLLYAATGTIATSSSTTLDLATGLNDPLGNALVFVRVKMMLIINYGAASLSEADVLVVGGAASNPFVAPFAANTTACLSLPSPYNSTSQPGMALLVAPGAAGWALGSGVNLKLANTVSASTITYTIVVIGAAS